MKVIFKINGSDFFAEEIDFLPNPGTEIKIYNNSFIVLKSIINFDVNLITPYIAEILPIETNIQTYFSKKARCVKVWEQSLDNLTKGKEYNIIEEEEDKFWILTDKGNKRHYNWENSQFVILQ